MREPTDTTTAGNSKSGHKAPDPHGQARRVIIRLEDVCEDINSSHIRAFDDAALANLLENWEQGGF